MTGPSGINASRAQPWLHGTFPRTDVPILSQPITITSSQVRMTTISQQATSGLNATRELCPCLLGGEISPSVSHRILALPEMDVQQTQRSRDWSPNPKESALTLHPQRRGPCKAGTRLERERRSRSLLWRLSRPKSPPSPTHTGMFNSRLGCTAAMQGNVRMFDTSRKQFGASASEEGLADRCFGPTNNGSVPSQNLARRRLLPKGNRHHSSFIVQDQCIALPGCQSVPVRPCLCNMPPHLPAGGENT